MSSVNATEVEDLALDTAWLLHTGMGISMMQAGFMLMEVGGTESKNVKSVIMKNICDFSFGVVIWHLFGFGLYTGDSSFAGGANSFFFVLDPEMFAFAFQQFGFCSVSITIVSGAILGRSKLEEYVFFAMLFVGFIYPINAHWAWMPNGWLKSVYGFKDFAGSGVVHMVGGTAAFVYAYLIGPREGKFWRPVVVMENGTTKLGPTQVRELRGHSPAMTAFGVLILYVAWFSFNGGGVVFGNSGEDFVASRAVYNTFLASGVAITCGVIYGGLVLKVHDLRLCVNSFLAGLVAITGPCGYVDPYAAIIVGIVAPLVSRLGCNFIVNVLHIDDPVDAVATHYLCGLTGILLTGIFAIDGGAAYTGNGKLLLGQFIGALAMTAWTAFLTLLFLLPMQWRNGLAVPKEAQMVGLDAYYFDGYAFPDQGPSGGAVASDHKEKTKETGKHPSANASSSDLERRRLKKAQKLQKILKDPLLRKQLRAYLEEYREGEGLDFLDHVSKFEAESNHFVRAKIARHTISNFVLESAKTQVNLQSSTRQALSEAFLNGAESLSHHGLFFTAFEEVLQDISDNNHVAIFIAKTVPGADAANLSLKMSSSVPQSAHFSFSLDEPDKEAGAHTPNHAATAEQAALARAMEHSV